MKVEAADGVFYCQDCDKVIVDVNRESIWYCPEHAKKRGWNIIDRKRIKVHTCGQLMAEVSGGVVWHCPKCDVQIDISKK